MEFKIKLLREELEEAKKEDPKRLSKAFEKALASVSDGLSTIKDIGFRCGYGDQTCKYVVNTLIELGYVGKDKKGLALTSKGANYLDVNKVGRGYGRVIPD